LFIILIILALLLIISIPLYLLEWYRMLGAALFFVGGLTLLSRLAAWFTGAASRSFAVFAEMDDPAVYRRAIILELVFWGGGLGLVLLGVHFWGK
jgi:hypothetical protein